MQFKMPFVWDFFSSHAPSIHPASQHEKSHKQRRLTIINANLWLKLPLGPGTVADTNKRKTGELTPELETWK